MAAVVKDLVQLNAEIQQQKDKAETVDFKMITFALAGKEYGVDIMNVKEIAKADKFTFVPNASSFVRGVYNLRGDIIPIIDLRNFFHLPQENQIDSQENMLILRVNEQVYGTIVDKIDKVVGIDRETIQPPHPIFGDINIKYISGVVEKLGSLYVILDVVRIFGQKEVAEEEAKETASSALDSSYLQNQTALQEQSADSKPDGITDTAFGFVKEGLQALRRFTVSSVNQTWARKRFEKWGANRSLDEVQLRTAAEADDFLQAFGSPFTGEFWEESYATEVKNILPKMPSNNIQVWNIGCAKGFETFSFLCILKTRYPDGRIKIWANDNDIMAVSQASNLAFELKDIPEYCKPFVVKSRSGYTFTQAIKESVVFEYHDVLHDNPLPELDIVLARDVLSFFSEKDQGRVLADIEEKLKPNGVVFLGQNEEVPNNSWTNISKGAVSAFVRNA